MADLAPPPPAPAISPVAPAPAGSRPTPVPNLGQGGDPSILEMALQKGAEQMNKRPVGRPPGSKNVAQPLNQGQNRRPEPQTPPARQPAGEEPPPPSAPTVSSNLLKDLERLHGTPQTKLTPLPPPEAEAPPAGQQAPGSTPPAEEVTAENLTFEQAEKDADEIIRNPHAKAKTRAVIEKFRMEARTAREAAAAALKAPAEITEESLPEPIKNRLKERDMLMFERNADALPEVQKFKADIAVQDKAIIATLSKYFAPDSLKGIEQAGGYEKFIQTNPDAYEQIKNAIPGYEFDQINLRRGEALRITGAMDGFIQAGKANASEILKQHDGAGKNGSENILRSLRQWQTAAYNEVPLLKAPVMPANATKEQQEAHGRDMETNKQLRGLIDSHIADIASGDVKRVSDAAARLSMFALNGVSAMVLAQTWQARAEFFEKQYNRMKGTQLGNPGEETPRVAPVEEKKEATPFKAGMKPADALAAMAQRMTADQD